MQPTTARWHQSDIEVPQGSIGPRQELAWLDKSIVIQTTSPEQDQSTESGKETYAYEKNSYC